MGHDVHHVVTLRAGLTIDGMDGLLARLPDDLHAFGQDWAREMTMFDLAPPLQHSTAGDILVGLLFLRNTGPYHTFGCSWLARMLMILDGHLPALTPEFCADVRMTPHHQRNIDRQALHALASAAGRGNDGNIVKVTAKEAKDIACIILDSILKPLKKHACIGDIA